jgi:hypothetical protein
MDPEGIVPKVWHLERETKQVIHDSEFELSPAKKCTALLASALGYFHTGSF